jgi:hypothetical protein
VHEIPTRHGLFASIELLKRKKKKKSDQTDTNQNMFDIKKRN